MSPPTPDPPPREVRPRPPGRSAVRWAVSLVGAAVLVAVAGHMMPLWPERPPQLDTDEVLAAAAAFAAYLWVRAHRLSVVLDPLARQAGLARYPRSVLWGGGLVSFFVLLLLPLRLGELSRPLVFDRADTGGVRLAEALSATAVERVSDGLALCLLLLAGLLRGARGGAAGGVAHTGAVFLAAFVVALAALVAWGRRPARVGAAVARIAERLQPRWGRRASAAVERGAYLLRTLGSPFRIAVFAGWTAVYWGLAVAYPYLLARAVGLDADLLQMGMVVAVVGLAIQLPGGPAQVGSFQVGAATGIAAAGLDPAGDPAAAFGLLLYGVQFAGTAAGAMLGLVVLGVGGRGTGAAAARSIPMWWGGRDPGGPREP